MEFLTIIALTAFLHWYRFHIYVHVRNDCHYIIILYFTVLFTLFVLVSKAVQYSIFVAWFGLMVFNATFNNISAISWRSVLLVEETGGPGENHRPVASH